MRRAFHRVGGTDSRRTVGQRLPLGGEPGAAAAARLAFVLLAASLLAASAQAQEARCLELGQSCECSEPMDTTSTSIQDGHNFSDSPAAYQCDKFGTFFGTNKTNISTVPESGMPSANTVDRVVQIPAGGGSIVWLKGRQAVDSSIKRECIRYYKRVSPDYSGVGPNNIGCPSERNKVIQYQFGGWQVQLQERADGSFCTGPGTGRDYEAITLTNPAIANFNLSPRVDWEDCWSTNGWCRIEMCASGNLSQGTNINFEAKITTLKDGVDHYANQNQLWNPGSGMKSDTGGDLFHGQGQGGKGTEWISHFMQASWTSNQGQWIGKSYEIESGSNPPPPPPPPPAAPLAPVLLPQQQTPPSGQEALLVSLDTSGGAPMVTSVVANGVGTYLFLFDCGLDGNWNGVIDTPQPTASYTCPAGTSSIKANVWDKGSNFTKFEIVSVGG